MNKASSWTNYEERLSRVTDYIYDHLDEEIDLQKLADVACLSPYHWHRTYQALRGETIAATVKRLRLHRAAGYLAQTTMPIEKIASRSGYKNTQSFTRLFKSAYGMPPAQFRKRGGHAHFRPQNRESNVPMNDIQIKNMPGLKAVGVEHIGSYMDIGKAFDTLYARLGARNLVRPDMRSIGIYHDDPSAVPEAELRSRACVIVDEDFPVEPPLEVMQIPGGPYAVLRHKGPYADMKAAYQWLYGVWLVQSGREAANAPVFKEYLNSPRDTAPTELMTDICLPLSRTGSQGAEQ